ncbi:MAG TPA: FUSC family protein, partial [Xanthobacteraceae bacterium]|nr:FUSC family protein [Xanthobacteraceae bacterium]
LFLGALALWGGASALTATLLRNFAAYAAALAGYTAAIVAGDLLGATGGINADAAFLLAVSRGSEICIGIVCAGVVLAGTDLGGARRRLAAVFAALSSEITGRFTDTLTVAGANFDDTQRIRWEFVRRVIALDPVIDEAIGESSQLRYHSPVLQRAVDGLFTALVGWRAVANHLVRLSDEEARRGAASVLESVPQQLRSAPEDDQATRWIADPIGLHRICAAAIQKLIALPAETPSLRLLADQTASVLAGMMHAVNGLALLVVDPANRVARRGSLRLRVPDWLPALVNAGRAFAAIGAVALFWIVTEWPSGASAISFAAIIVILLAPRADQAYAAGIAFLLGTLINVVLTATIAFAVLPGSGAETFATFSLVVGLCLVPIGALLAQARQPWQAGMFTGMTMTFMPLLAPTNQMDYDTVQFYNSTLAVVAGTAAALLSFRLLPPLSPAYRTRRLLALSLRDLRRLATGRTYRDWFGHIGGRLVTVPDAATPLQRAQLLAALSVGSEIVQLRDSARRLGLNADLDPALAAVAHGDTASATTHLARLDAALAAHAATGPEMQTVLRARGSILVISETLAVHAVYFGSGTQG